MDKITVHATMENGAEYRLDFTWKDEIDITCLNDMAKKYPLSNHTKEHWKEKVEELLATFKVDNGIHDLSRN